MKTLEKYPILMIIVGILGVSLSAIFVRISTAPSAVTAAYRLIFVVLMMSPAVWGNAATRQEVLSLKPKTLLLSAVSGLFLAAHFFTWFESLHHTTVASTSIICCTEVIWVAIGFCLFLKGRLSGKALLAIAVTLLGSVLIAWSDFGGTGLYGDLLALIAAIAVAGYTLLGRVVRGSTSTTVYTYIVYVCCGTALLILTAVQGYSLTGYGPRAYLAGALLAVFSTMLGHSIFSWCLKFFSPTFVSASKLCEPVISSIFAAFLFGEIPGMLQILGGIIVLAGVIYYSVIEVKEES